MDAAKGISPLSAMASERDTGGTKSTASATRSLLPTSETREQAWFRSAT